MNSIATRGVVAKGGGETGGRNAVEVDGCRSSLFLGFTLSIVTILKDFKNSSVKIEKKMQYNKRVQQNVLH